MWVLATGEPTGDPGPAPANSAAAPGAATDAPAPESTGKSPEIDMTGNHAAPAVTSAGQEAPPPPQEPPAQAQVPSGGAPTGTARAKALGALAGFPEGETAAAIWGVFLSRW